MLTIVGFLMILAVVGVVVLAAKLLLGLVLLPFKIGFGVLKIGLAVLLGIPLLVCCIAFAAALVPIALVLGLIAIPVVLVSKVLF